MAEERKENGMEYISSHIPVIRKSGAPEGKRTTLHEKNGVCYLTFESLEREVWLSHAFSTRLGGVSEGTESTLNLGFSREENRDNVMENFRRFGEASGMPLEHMVMSYQTHTPNIRRMTAGDIGKGFFRDRDYADVDGMITDEKGVCLVTSFADCVPLLAADPVRRAIGSAHSGWKGTMADVGGELIRAMQASFGTRPEDVIAVIGPSICQDCYEVSADVIEKAKERYADREEIWDRLWYAKENGKYQLNLWECCRENFLEAGVAPDHIQMPDLCTCCNPQLLFSHRASKGRHGNLAALMEIL